MTDTTLTPTTDERAGLPSASGIYRIANCPGSVAMACLAPPDPSTTAVALDGEDIHRALETDQFDDLEESQEEIARRLKEIETTAVQQWRDDRQITDVPKVIREERLWIHRASDLQPVASAKVDLAVVGTTEAILIDYKTGFRSVTPAEKNWQIRTGIVALKHEYPDLQYVRGAIAHARLGAKYDHVDYDASDIALAEQVLFNTLRKADQSDAPRYAGEWCRYCPARGVCRESAAWASLDVPTPALQTGVKLEKEQVAEYVAALTPAQLRKMWERKTLIESILTAGMARLKSMPESDLNTIGLRLRSTGSATELVDPAGAMRALTLQIGEENAWSTIRITSEKAAKHLAKANQTSQKKAKEELETLLAPFAVKHPKEKAIAALS